MTARIISKYISIYKNSDKSLEDIANEFKLSKSEFENLVNVVNVCNISKISAMQEKPKRHRERPMSFREITLSLNEYNSRLDEELISSFDKILLKDEIRGYER